MLNKIISVIFSLALGGVGDGFLIQTFIEHPEALPLSNFIIILVSLTGASGWLVYRSIK